MARARGPAADVELVIEGRTVVLSQGAARRLRRSLAAALGTTGRDPDTLRAIASGHAARREQLAERLRRLRARPGHGDEIAKCETLLAWS